jgi:predicted esterase
MRKTIAALLMIASQALAQAAPNTNLALIGWTALKNRVRPQGELAAQVATIDSTIRQAAQRGHTAEVRRHIARGTALLNGREWADTSDYRQSLVLRTDHVFVDPTQPWSVRLEQTYAPSIVVVGALTARATLRPAFVVPGGSNPTSTSSPYLRTLSQFSDVSRDLRDTPLRMELDLTGTPNGDYTLDVEVADSLRTLGVARLRFTVLAGLSARVASLEAKAAKASAVYQASLRYPADYMRKIDRGVINAGTFNLAAELSAAESLATAANLKRQAPSVKPGHQERHYVLQPANEIMPYRVFVPSAYDGKKSLPLIVALHGAGGNEDGFMDSYGRELPRLAELHGYIVASPMGFRVDGGYGSRIMGGNAGVHSERDVMEVLALMRKDYKVDDKRIYLMGHSMGGIGTWHLGQKYPEIWAALASFAGIGVPASAERVKAIPQFVVHGDADNTVNVQRSRDMVAALKALGVDHKYLEIAGGGHNDVVTPNLAAMVDFFDAKRKQ